MPIQVQGGAYSSRRGAHSPQPPPFGGPDNGACIDLEFNVTHSSRYIPMRYMSHEVHAHEVHAHEIHP
jgi:hypothetical protein